MARRAEWRECAWCRTPFLATGWMLRPGKAKRYCRRRCANFAQAIVRDDEFWREMGRKSAQVRSTKARTQYADPAMQAAYDKGYAAGWSARNRRGRRKVARRTVAA